MRAPLAAALVDVGGTLWPNSWPLRENDTEDRVARVRAALSTNAADRADRLVADLIKESRFSEAADADTKAHVVGEANAVVKKCLEHHQMHATPEDVAKVRRAMALPVVDRFLPLAGAVELLAAIKELGLTCVIASNTYWRDASGYREDFDAMGMGASIDAIVTSVDAGYMKPHPALFHLAMKTAGTTPVRCVMIGNKEDNDILPAAALGMRTILVHPDDPIPASSKADAVAPDLWKCAETLRLMLGRA